MPGRLKWLLIGLLAFGVFGVAQAVLEEFLYVPVTMRVFGATPTPTIVPGVYITTVNFDPPGNPLDEYVAITNFLGTRVDLTEWTVSDENKNICTIGETSPSGLYTLYDDAELWLWTRDGVPEVGVGDHDNLYCAFTQPIWNDHGDRVYLRDQNGDLIDDFAYGSASRGAAPALGATPPPPAPPSSAPPSPALTPSPTPSLHDSPRLKP